MMGMGVSETVVMRGIGLENADRVNVDRIGIECRRFGSRGAENSCRCMAAPECRNILMIRIGKDAPGLGAPSV